MPTTGIVNERQRLVRNRGIGRADLREVAEGQRRGRVDLGVEVDRDRLAAAGANGLLDADSTWVTPKAPPMPKAVRSNRGR